MVFENDEKSHDEDFHYVATTDEQTAKKLIDEGLELIKQEGNRWVFKNLQ